MKQRTKRADDESLLNLHIFYASCLWQHDLKIRDQLKQLHQTSVSLGHAFLVDPRSCDIPKP
jgi:hypothetical protein